MKILQHIRAHADPESHYEERRKIGQASVIPLFSHHVSHHRNFPSPFVEVYQATRKEGKLSVIIKQIEIKGHSRKDLGLLIDEYLALRDEKEHRNLVNYIDSFRFEGLLWVVMKYAPTISLKEVIDANSSKMAEMHIAAVLKEITPGLDHLHRHGVYHGNVNSLNVLLTRTRELQVTLSEFNHPIAN
jgi:serine/threonine protein kinase